MTTPCVQTKEIESLKINQALFMEKIDNIANSVNNVSEKVDSIHKYIFEGALDEKFANKRTETTLKRVG
jgi:hypothetical protein